MSEIGAIGLQGVRVPPSGRTQPSDLTFGIKCDIVNKFEELRADENDKSYPESGTTIDDKII